ncbi:MFS transporter [Protaetiibacter sp. SSC-01]|uniref:MFS transporter n=1 Tax=Protaetiibacter sp. SSC-01 TaxID=2759943 RepID=UPI001656D992|nr:MFS transporter [Protaetiibacter sp. SSC-01]QNO37183.1 MFS transporter [Protaetiibacter sp. SSC-01]
MTQPSTDAAPITRIAHLARITGVWFFVLGFVARIPFAMNIVGLLTLVTVVRGSIAEAGLVSAAFGIAMGVGGPLLGAIADRHGQRIVSVVVSILHAALLLGIVAAVYGDTPFWLIFVLTLLAGATIPPVAAYARARWLALLDDDTRRGGRGVSTALGYESMVEEITFVGGPVLVGVLATLISPAAPVIVAAFMVLVFASAFGLHRTARAVQPGAAHPDAVVAPRRALVSLAVLLPVAGMLFMGAYFGSTLASVTAVMEEVGLGESTGLVYGVMGATSAVAAITVGRLPRTFPLHLRWVLGASAMLVAGLVLWAAPQLPVIIVVFVFVGVAVGATLVTVFTIGAESAPAGRLATNMAMLSSAVTIGQGLTVATVGAFAEAAGTASVFASVAIASAGMLLVAISATLQHRALRARIAA